MQSTRLLFADSKNRDYPSGNIYRDAERPVADISASLHLTTPIVSTWSVRAGRM